MLYQESAIRNEDTAASTDLTSKLQGYALATILIVVALAFTFPLQEALPTVGFFFFYAAIAASAWFGGKAVGWYAVLLGTATVYWFFIPPRYTFGIEPQAIPVFIECCVSSLVASWFSAWRKQVESELKYARDGLQLRVRERTAELQQTNRQLLAEMAERKRAEDAYYEAQAELARVTRVSAMGALAASISHEVNQPLTAVVANADASTLWLSNDPPNLDEARTAVGSIAREATRASDIIRRIRAIYAKAAPERIEVRVHDLVGEACALTQAEAARNQVALETELESDLPAVMGDPVQLKQVLVNLIVNGIEAMITTTDRPRRLVIRSEKLGSDEVQVSVCDSGPGIDPNYEARIFDAFFTSKADGMGMGLSISHSIIESHAGRLWAVNNRGQGATFQFTLPAAGENAS